MTLSLAVASTQKFFGAEWFALLELILPFVLSFHLSRETNHANQLLGSLPASWLQLVGESAAA
jgi:hypothetical protein